MGRLVDNFVHIGCGVYVHEIPGVGVLACYDDGGICFVPGARVIQRGEDAWLSKEDRPSPPGRGARVLAANAADPETKFEPFDEFEPPDPD